MQQSPSLLNSSINSTSTTLPSNQQQQLLSRPASAYFNSNTSSLNNPNPSATSSNNNMTPNLNQSMSYNMMAPASNTQQAQLNTHISHPNLSNMPSSSTNTNPSLVQMPLTANRPPILPNKNNFMRESQSQHSLRMTHQQQPPQQQQMMAPSMPNIAHASGYATNISSSQSMQNVNQINPNYPLYNPQQQQSQMSPSQQHQNSLMRGQAKMADINEIMKQQRRANQQQPQITNGMVHTNSMDNISMNQYNQQTAQQQLQNKPFGPGNMPQSPQKQLPPTTAPKPLVSSKK